MSSSASDCVEPRSVHTYGPEGERRRNSTHLNAEYLVSRNLVIAQRNRKGLIMSIHFIGATRMPLQARLRTGTRYRHQERVGDQKIWTHRDLPFVRERGKELSTTEVRHQSDRQVRAVFASVQLSVLRPEPRGFGADCLN